MSLTKVSFSMIEGASANVLDYGADPTGVADSTSAIQAALDSGINNVYLPSGTYLFSTLIVNKNTRLHGASTRTSILKHTGAAIAVQCIYSGTEPDGRGEYIDNGWFIFEDFELMANGTVGFSTGKTKSTFTQWHNIHMRHRRDLEAGDPNNQYFPGSTAINCDNAPWVNYPTWINQINHCFMRGFENAVNLNDTVNAWQINQLYTIECKKHVVLNKVTGITMSDCYFESGIVAAQGIVFGSGGGNKISVLNTTFELTNAAATQFAYNFTAGGTWSDITVLGCKYLLVGDGNGVNNKRITGTAPISFVELGRTYTSATLGTIPMLWAPGCSSTKPFQQPNYSRFGGFQQGSGKIFLGRSGSDASDGWIENDGAYGLNFVAPGNGSVVDFNWKGNDGTTHLQYQGYGSGTYGIGFYSGFDNAIPLGQASRRWSVVYAGTGTINTSDERAKEQDRQLSDVEKAVAIKVKGLLKAFKFKDAVEKKSEKARIHFGVYAQEVASAFESEGLNADDYGMFCYDEWPANELTGEPAGNRYGIRYDELLAFVIGAM